jgi:hypothetical protein
VTAVLFVATSFGTGFLVGWVAGRIRKTEQLRTLRANEVAEAFLNGRNHGYHEGWTTGRVRLFGEQQSRDLHPTGRDVADPVTQAATVIDLAARRLGKGHH